MCAAPESILDAPCRRRNGRSALSFELRHPHQQSIVFGGMEYAGITVAMAQLSYGLLGAELVAHFHQREAEKVQPRPAFR
jgi:hypothetical protein